ncbi:MAG: glycerate kinase, partial [Lentisphaerae bacterium]|nr:glycerate kinase [Lentisphaerota bacterium]
FPEGAMAVVEMAVASGLPLLAEHERNPLLTSTRGTGELIRAAVEQGAQRVLLAIGGSATVDGGIGAAAALGWRFLDDNGRDVPAAGGHLKQIAKIVPPPQRLRTEITVLCDVTNPLCGPRGAATVFGPQKGATPEMVGLLEDGLLHLAQCVRRDLGCDVLNLPGGGAAGGLGAGAVAFFGAQLAPGIATVMEACKLDESLRDADWCLTGEGSFDNQSLQGKVVSGVAGLAREQGVPVVVLAGRVKADPAEYRVHGIQAALATHAPDMPMEQVLLNERALLRVTAARWRKSLDD